VPPSDHLVTLLIKPGCPHCDDAREVLERISVELGVAVEERDATLDPTDLEEYGERLPVVLLDGREHGYWDVDEPRLRRDLAR
jgi:glutaredoxin